MHKTYKELRTEFEKYDTRIPQDIFDAYLQTEVEKYGLPAALDLLLKWEAQVGMYDKENLKLNRHFHYPDPQTGITFHAQVNYARDKYSSKSEKKPKNTEFHCPLCYEYLGSTGNENLRGFRFSLDSGRAFHARVSPYPLFHKHFILVTKEKVLMRMDRTSVEDLADFLDMAPAYTCCSNSDVEWAGVSFLDHHHYHVMENVAFPVMEARYLDNFHFAQKVNALPFECGLLDFPSACCKVVSREKELFNNACGNIIIAWKQASPGQNTCNLVMTKNECIYTCYIVFRNPAFRTAPEHTKVKSEGVGYIEMVGEGVYPVPKGDAATEAWNLIEEHGLDVIKGIMQSNSPVRLQQFGELFETIVSALKKAL